MTRSTSIAALLVLVATVVAYAPALQAPYEFDDVASIPANASIRTLHLPSALSPPENTSVSGRPLVNYTFAIDNGINRMLSVDERPDPDGANKTVVHHVGNVLLHLLCGALIFLLVQSAIGANMALAVTALWILHPIQSEAVNYLVQRTELLVSLCYLLVLYAAARAWDADASSSRWRWSLLSLIAFIAGLASKEVILTAPVAVLLFDILVRNTSVRAAWVRSDRRALYLALGILSLVRAAMLAGGARSGTVGFGLGVPWYSYLYSQGWAITHYLRLVLLPAGFTLDYGYRPIHDWRGVVGGLGVLCLMGATAFALKRRPQLAFLGCAFFLLLAPSSSVVPITTEIAAERRMYLALLPVLVLVVLAARSALRNWPHKRQVAAVVLVAALFAVLTGARSRLYHDPEALWRDAVAHAPDNARAHDNLAATMFYHDPPRLAEAKSLYERAIVLDSSYVHAYTGLASVAVNEGRLTDAEGILRRALTINPGYSDAVAHLGQLYLRMKQPVRAVPYLSQFAAAYPSDNAYLELGRAQLRIGQLDSARISLMAALARNPNRTDAMHYLGGLLAERGDGALASSLLERVISSGHGTPIDVGLLALSYAESGRAADAVEAAQAAAEQANGNPAVFILAARALLVAGRTSESKNYLNKALRIDPANPEARLWLDRAK